MKISRGLQVIQEIISDLNEETVIGFSYSQPLDHYIVQLDSVDEVNKFCNVKISFLDEDLKYPFEHYTYVHGVKIFALSEDALCLVKP